MRIMRHVVKIFLGFGTLHLRGGMNDAWTGHDESVSNSATLDICMEMKYSSTFQKFGC